MHQARYSATSAGRRLIRTAIGAALALAPCTSPRGETTFDSAVLYGAGTAPAAIAIGDLDRDQDADFAVVNAGGHLQVLFNEGAGTFQDAVAHENLWPSGSFTVDVQMADLDRDGDNDLAVAFTTLQGSVSILFNHGDGTFAAPVNYDSCYSTQGITVGDFDGDLHRDLAGMSNCFKASILLNDGSGGLRKKGDFGIGYVPGGIASADLDGDRDRDIVYSNGTNDLTVLLNDGAGAFTFSSIEEHDQPQWIVLADLDQDTDNDIAVANLYTNDIGIFINGGTGSFTGPVKYGAGVGAKGLAGGDLDNDGDIDLVAANGGSDDVTLRWNAGNGTFPTQTAKAAGDGPTDVAVGDLNGDARLDLVVVNSSGDSVAVILNSLNAAPDADDDGMTDAADCAPADASSWAPAPSVNDLLLSDSLPTRLSWSVPSLPGGATPRYDLLRSANAGSFLAAACLESGGTDTVAVDPAAPARLAAYLVRIRNACGGNLGTASSGLPRSGPLCP
jgi:hypothetical protein